MNKDYLRNLALKYESDKAGHHEYCGPYQEHFEKLANEPIKLIEIGIGGYNFPARGGAGLRMWSDFFPNGQIFGIDIYDKSGIKLPPRTRIFKGSQSDGDFLTKVMAEIGQPDVVVDDGSHINDLTILSFQHLFPWLKSGGIYVIEDLETSWWQAKGADGTDFKGCSDENNLSAPTTMNFLRLLINDVNQARLPKRGYWKEIESMHFYDNLCFIKKK